MENVYIPNYNSNKCAIIYDKDTIRVYDYTPSYNSQVNYTDYFINSDYLERKGTQVFNQYSNLPTCLNSNIITDDFIYRVDMWKFCIIFSFFLLILILGIKCTIFRLFRRFN